MNAEFEIEEFGHGYAPRTMLNARSADLTIAFAVDYSTGGEVLTERVAQANYLRLPLQAGPAASAAFLREFRRRRDNSFNIAGNGLRTLHVHGWSQAAVNQHIFSVLQTEDLRRPITYIVCGGQTGADIAGAVAAFRLKIPCKVRMPQGCLQRGATGPDFRNTPEDILDYVRRAAGELQ